MATSIETVRTEYPLPSYNYRVEIGSEAASFSEVSGLSITYAFCTYAESPLAAQAGSKWSYFPGQMDPVAITLKKGVVRTVSIKVQTNLVEKKDIFIRLCDEKGDPVISWKVVNAFPISLSAPTFDAASNDAAIETMELRADFISLEEV
jgi:phage tail-like protein